MSQILLFLLIFIEGSMAIAAYGNVAINNVTQFIIYPRRPRNCEDLQLTGTTASGIYRIFPGTLIEKVNMGIEVYCDFETDKGGWTLLMRQVETEESLQINFDREWKEYVEGFGRLDDSFWLGLENILQLTKLGSELRVDLEDWNNQKAFAVYSHFQIGCEKENYTLSVSEYSGSAGDSLGAHSGHQFSAKDRDNDIVDDNCAIRFGGGWWFYSCYHCHLTGRFSTNPNQTHRISWYTWGNSYRNLKAAEMKIRSKNFKAKLK